MKISNTASVMTCIAFVVTGFFVSDAQADDIPYLRCFELASKTHQVPIETLIGVARVESAFNPSARSPANAHGIMQIRWPLTAKHLGVKRVSELYNPCVNIDIGAQYLAELLRRYAGNETLALAAYNYGPSRLKVEQDIPRTVGNYVQKVRRAEPDSEKRGSSGVLQVNRFTSQTVARRYADAINTLIDRPLAKVSAQRARRTTHYVVTLDRGDLSPFDRVRLGRIINLEENKS